MDPFFIATNLSKMIQQIEPIVVFALVVLLIIVGSEKIFGLNVRGFIDGLEKAQTEGNSWPLTVFVLGCLVAIIWLVRGF